jgi:predicted CXXCH cytochrome family protein
MLAHGGQAEAAKYVDPSAATTCEYTTELRDPLARKLYIEEVERETGRSQALTEASSEETRSSSLFSFFKIAETAPGTRSGGSGIDRFSQRCLSCHDDIGASLGEISIRYAPRSRRGSSMQETNHPIGMTYNRYASVRGFKSGAAANKDMKFFEGKVGCLTCHDPINPAKNHLVMSDRQSALCLTCHDK